MAAVAKIGSAVLSDPRNGVDSTTASLLGQGSITLSGNYGGAATHGDTLDLTVLGLASDYPPQYVNVYQEPTSGSAPIRYAFLYGRGTTLANGVLIVIDTTTGLEITQGNAYPAALTAATANIRLEAELAKNI